jgi:MFS family permease
MEHRNFRLYWFGQMISQTGNWMQLVAQGWLVYQLTDSPLMLGIVSVVGLLPVVPISLLAGVISDRFPRRKLIIGTEIVLMLQALALAWLTWQNTIQVWHVIALSFVLGAAASLEQPARLAFVVDITSEEDLTNAVALNASVYNIARVIGPVFAGLLMGAIGAAGCFLVNGLSYLPVILALLAIRISSRSRPVVKTNIGGSLMHGFGYMWRTQTLRSLMLLVAVSSFFALPYITLLPAFAEEVLAVGPQGLGWLTTMAGVGAVAGALFVANVSARRRGWWLIAGNLLGPIFLVFFSLSGSFALSLALLVLVGAGNAVRNTLANSLLQLNADGDYQGRVMSVYNLLFNGMSRVGALGIGGLAQFVGVPLAVGMGAVISVIWGLLVIWRMPHVQRLQ